MIDTFSHLFLQVVDNATQTLAPAIIPAIQQTQDTVATNTNGIIATATALVSGLVGKHLYDSKKRNDTISTASDIDKMQMQEIADNYNDFSQVSAVLEALFRVIVQNPDSKLADILAIVTDDITKQTMGMKLIQVFQDIQKYNEQYYKNTAFKPNSLTYNGKNPLKNVQNMVRDMSTAS
jgi:hypothetical protein